MTPAGSPATYTLRRLLTLAFTLLLTVSIGAYSLYTAIEQSSHVERLEREQAGEIVRHLARDLEQPLATGDADELSRRLKKIQGVPSIQAFMVTDRRGYPLSQVQRRSATHPFEDVAVGDLPMSLPDTQRGTDTARIGSDGRIVAWADIGDKAPIGWLRLEMQPVAAKDSLHHILQDSAPAGLLTLILGTLAIHLMLRPVLYSLERATRFAETLETGRGENLSNRSQIAEIRQLEDALNQASTRIFKGQSALAASESRNRAITEASLDAIITIDGQGRILDFNRAAESIFGITRSETLGHSATELFVPERFRESRAGEVQALFDTPAPDILGKRIETVALRADQSEFPAEVALATFESGGNRLLTAYVRDISERRAAEAFMREAKEAAEANSRSKSDFLANMSHEIRTPMNAILGMTDLALETPLDDEQREYLSLVKSSANSLLNIINDILDFSKIEAGKLDFEHIDFSLRDCVALAIRTLQQRAAEKDLQLAVRVAPDVPDGLMGDPHRLRQVLINLLSNGIKFTPTGGVTLTVEPGPQEDDDIQLLFSVKDTGVGIPADKQSLIFEAFSQADTSTTRRYGGTGLGLTISTQLIRAMGGEITVVSTPGEGSIFRFTARFAPGSGVPLTEERTHLEGLPVLVAIDNPEAKAAVIELLGQWRMSPCAALDGDDARREMVQAQHLGHPYRVVIISTQLPDTEGFQLAESLRQIAEAPPCVLMLAGEGRRGDGARCRELGISAYLPMPIEASDLLNSILLAVDPIDDKGSDRPLITRHTLREQRRQLRILLAEDNVVNQTLALRLLAKLGHQVDVAGDGLEALALHEHHRYDIILMDVQMPKMGGFEATARIRARETSGFPRTPIVAMTAHAMKGDRERCLQAGMDGYLSKPVHAPDLVEALIHQVGSGDPPPPPATESAPNGEPVFDREKVLANLGDDADLLAQLVAMYCEDEARMLAEIEAAIVAGDGEGLRNTAHALKGAVSNFCAKRAQAKAQQLERMGKEREIDTARQVFNELKDELDELRKAFLATG
ncbi:response regulator [Zoogloea sp.]|uniref:response regulator n=1 Tax=Zoogloea sp. TaxID=49181 RepID=UPI002630E7AF|nr:response regulator [Zoogloea sp.]MDD3353966.1 response regulator [Zoogloea sp.]